MSDAPVTTSPAAKTSGTSVWSVPRSTLIVELPLTLSRPEKATVSGVMPMATITASQSMTNSLLGIGSGLRRPEASG